MLSVTGGGSDFVWSPAAGLDTTKGDSVVATPTATVTYAVTGIDSMGCKASGTDVMTLGTVPVKPSFTQHNDTLVSSSRFNNQWYRNDTMLQNDTGQTLIISVLGNYWVVVVNEANGCGTSSDTLNITSITGVPLLTGDKGLLTIYPNPVSEQLTLSGVGFALDDIGVINVLGQVMLKVLPVSSDDKITIDMSGLQDGTYFIIAANKTTRVVAHVIKQ